MGEYWLLVIAILLLGLAVGSDYGSRLLPTGSASRFVCEKIVSRSLGFGAIILFVLFGIEMLT